MSKEARDLGPIKAVGDKIWHSSWKIDVTIVEVRQIGPKSPVNAELDFMAYTVEDEKGRRDARFANWFHVNAKRDGK